MADSRDHDGGPPMDSDAFREWVEYTADARNVDEKELLNQLVSAFWVLDEMNGVTEDGDLLATGTPPRPLSEASSELDDASSDPRSKSEADSGSSSPTRTDVGQAGNADGETDRREDPSKADPGGETPREGRPGKSPEERDDGNARFDGADGEALAEEMRTLRESVYGQLEVVQAVAEIRREVSDLSLDVEQQRSRQDQFTDRISDDLTRLHSRVETLETTLDERMDGTDEDGEASGVDEAELDRLSEELSTEIERLESTQREFETWIDGEFDEIEGLFERLIGTTDALEERLDGLEGELTEVREDVAADDRLTALRRDAIDLGTDTGRCDHCGFEVDLSMLDEAACPDCGATFTGMEPSAGWNPFAKPSVRTAVDTFDEN